MDKQKEKPTKIELGKNKTKVKMHPVLGDHSSRKIKENIISKIKKIILNEDKAIPDTLDGKTRSSNTPSQNNYDKCFNEPYDILGDPSSTGSQKDLAMQVINYWTENLEYNINEEDEREYIIEAVKNISKMSAEEKVQHVKDTLAARKFFKENPAHHNNIISHYNQATEQEKEHGMNWYDDLHHMLKHIARDTNTDMTTMAGLVGNYSPQTHWAENITTAAKVARTKQAVGGPSIKRDEEGNKIRGVFASFHQKNAAQRILNGEHYDNVMSGNKIKAFTHLAEFGGNDNDLFPKVAVDRHALSVAVGKRVSDIQYHNAGLKSKQKYDEVAGHYIKAAKMISAKEGKTIRPHQLQAITWLVRQRKNEAEEGDSRKLSTAKVAQSVTKSWNTYKSKFHPEITTTPGTGYSQ